MSAASLQSCAMCGAEVEALDEDLDYCEPCTTDHWRWELARAETAEEILASAIDVALTHLHEDDVHRIADAVIANKYRWTFARGGAGFYKTLEELREREHQRIAGRVEARREGTA